MLIDRTVLDGYNGIEKFFNRFAAEKTSQVVISGGKRQDRLHHTFLNQKNRKSSYIKRKLDPL